MAFTLHPVARLTSIGCPQYRVCEEQKGLSFGERWNLFFYLSAIWTSYFLFHSF